VQQKPWFYDLREVWAGFPKQVSVTYGSLKNTNVLKESYSENQSEYLHVVPVGLCLCRHVCMAVGF